MDPQAHGGRLPDVAMLQLLFDDASRTPTPRHTLIPVLAWLCNGNERWNGEVRCWVLRGAPEIHLEDGDAEALPLEFKRSLLESWIQRNSGRAEVWFGHSRDAMIGVLFLVRVFSGIKRRQGIYGNCWCSSSAMAA